jgi:hypothetical protein
MKQFFANLNFPRAVILGSVVLSLVLAFFAWQANSRRVELTDQCEKRVKKLSTEILDLALQLNQYDQRVDADQFGKARDPESYIRSVAYEPNVAIGDVDITPKTVPLRTGLVDKRFMIKPKNRQQPFTRREISNFLYRLEEKSRRVRVTHVKVEPQGKVKPDEIHKDVWTFDAEMTSRETTDEAPKKG